MPIIYNRRKNVLWELDLIVSERLDIEKNRSSMENWIPFVFILDVNGNRDDFKVVEPTFTIWEIEKMINGFEHIVSIMRQNPTRNIFEERFISFEHTCNEVYFDIKVSDADDNLIQIELWLNIAYFGIGGYKKGVSFDVYLDDFEIFTKGLKNQFNTICNGVL
jgi:hypothetical protein